MDGIGEKVANFRLQANDRFEEDIRSSPFFHIPEWSLFFFFGIVLSDLLIHGGSLGLSLIISFGIVRHDVKQIFIEHL